MPFVVYTAPNYTENAVRFIRSLANLEEVSLGLVSQEPLEWLPPDVQNRIANFHRVNDVFDPAQIETAVRAMMGRSGKPHRILGAVEQAQVPVAQVREVLGIEGMSVETALNFRDKGRMKNLMREAGLPCAHHKKVTSNKEAFAFAQAHGFPMVIKPPDGAASQATFRANNEAELAHALSMNPPTPDNEVLLEEFITGSEHSFDTFSIEGKPVFHSLTHYYPNCLEAMREPWIQWQVILPREVESPQYDDIKTANFKTLATLGMGTGMNHLEWFRRQDGSIAISEVAARPPGAQITTLISRANDFDTVAEWGRLMIFGTFNVPERKYAVGAAFLRGMGEGRVQRVMNLEHIHPEVRHLICDAKIPQPGAEKSKSYEGEGYIILRHPDTAIVKEALSHIVSTVRVIIG